ncbi:MAG: GGDEF domain-containing protein [Candidatus Omnitrophota bacterium]|nr:GGDEF domain-containing protein [Candidatus Omnitrophota bacterium]
MFRLDYFSSVTLLILLVVLLAKQMRSILSRSLTVFQSELTNREFENKNILTRKSSVEKENSILKKRLEETIALYDVTKEVSKFIDESLVFASFKEQLKSHLQVDDVQFIRTRAGISAYDNYKVLPLNINNVPVGYLLTRGISLGEEEKFHILATQFLLAMKRAILYQRVQELAITDSLTGVFSRRYFLERFEEELKRSKKFEYSLACLMIDVDHFKALNDKYGHLVGDVILKEVCRLVKENIRQVDIIGRYGGEEFCVVLAEAKINEVNLAAERILKAISSQKIRAYDEEVKLTVSIGIAVYPDNALQIQALIDSADQALYKAKQSGRNRIFFQKNPL